MSETRFWYELYVLAGDRWKHAEDMFSSIEAAENHVRLYFGDREVKVVQYQKSALVVGWYQNGQRLNSLDQEDTARR